MGAPRVPSCHQCPVERPTVQRPEGEAAAPPAQEVSVVLVTGGGDLNTADVKRVCPEAVIDPFLCPAP